MALTSRSAVYMEIFDMLNLGKHWVVLGLLALGACSSAASSVDQSGNQSNLLDPSDARNAATYVRAGSDPSLCPPEYQCSGTGFGLDVTGKQGTGGALGQASAFNGQRSVGLAPVAPPAPAAQGAPRAAPNPTTPTQAKTGAALGGDGMETSHADQSHTGSKDVAENICLDVKQHASNYSPSDLAQLQGICANLYPDTSVPNG